MNIIIKRKNHQSLLRHSKIKWKLYSQKNVRLFILYAAIGALLMVLNFVLLKQEEPYWSLMSSLGLAALFLSFFYFSHTNQNEKKFMAQTGLYVDRSEKYSPEMEIAINDEGVQYKDHCFSADMKWYYFNSFTLYEDYIFLIADTTHLSGILLHKNELELQQFEELLTFLRKRFHK